MNVREIMSAQVASCRAEDTNEHAAHLLWERDCGALPVLGSSDEVVGVVTDRDLCMAAYTRGARLQDLKVGEAMARHVFACRPEDSLETALGLMREHRVRRLPVLDEERRLLGLVSINDLVREVDDWPEGTERDGLALTVLETLSAIGAHREPVTELRPAESARQDAGREGPRETAGRRTPAKGARRAR